MKRKLNENFQAVVSAGFCIKLSSTALPSLVFPCLGTPGTTPLGLHTILRLSLLFAPKLSYEQILIPASVSVCRYVKVFTHTVCLISSGDPKDLVMKMYDLMEKISENSLERLRLRYSEILEELERRIHPGTEAKKFKEELEGWLKQLPVLEFNLGKFDFNLIRAHLIPYLLEKQIEIKQAIKKNNNYMALATTNLVLLDVCNYFAVGTSYAKWIKSWGV